MYRKANQPKSGRDGERGTIMVMTALLMLGLVLAVGLCIDVSRIYMVRTEMQNAADAAALAAARELNSGPQGIADAAARAAAIVNTQGLQNKANISIANVEFAVNLNGDYTSKQDFDAMGAQAQSDFAANVRFVRVTTQTTAVSILFAVRALGGTHPETAIATAGMSVGLTNICDFFPIGLALSNYPAPGPSPALPVPAATPITIKFVDSTGNEVTLADKNYVVLDTEQQGNGAVETKLAVAGVSPVCLAIGDEVWFSKTPSANMNNGPAQMEDGTNTRFEIYPPGNTLTYDTAKPDSNIAQTITWDDYKAGSPREEPTRTGEDDRRILVMPIIAPDTYSGSPPKGRIIGFEAFLLLKEVPKTKQCNKTPNTCGDITVEYIPDNIMIGRGWVDPNNAFNSSLTVPVLYK